MKPYRIFLVRHGESEGNVSKTLYTQKPDYALNLTSKGIEQAKAAGKEIKAIIGNESVGIYYSPFFRTRQTKECLEKEIGKFVFAKEDPRLREQEWSGKIRKNGYMHEIEAERDAHGHFYYRFEGGESCADVFDRVSDFLPTMFRDFEQDSFPFNVIIDSHGMTNRLFIMRWFHLNVEQFELLRNPKNCEVWRMERKPEGKYRMASNLLQYEHPSSQFPYTPLDL